MVKRRETKLHGLISQSSDGCEIGLHFRAGIAAQNVEDRSLQTRPSVNASVKITLKAKAACGSTSPISAIAHARDGRVVKSGKLVMSAMATPRDLIVYKTRRYCPSRVFTDMQNEFPRSGL
jgi:hypothetical protein